MSTSRPSSPESRRSETPAGRTWSGASAVVNHTTYGYSWAYNGSFNDSEDIELFVWSGPYDTTYETWVWIADSIAHEAGHSLGLNHDGTTTGIEYYPGHGEGITAWSPIMGWTNYGLSQWSKGEYTNANNPQDDLDIITTQNGFGYRVDDHGATLPTATPVEIDQPFVVDGVIEQPTDVDTFAFTVASDGDVLLTVRPDNLAPNLDLLATLSNAEGEVLHTSNPPDALDVVFDVYLEAGDYYLSVDGAGHEDPDSDGYSDYGTLGYYQVESGVEGGYGDEDEDEDGDGYGVADGDCDDEDVDCAPDARLEARGACGCSTGSPLGNAWPAALLVLLLRRRGAQELASPSGGCRHEGGGE